MNRQFSDISYYNGSKSRLILVDGKNITVNEKSFSVYNRGKRKISVPNELDNHGYLRILNDENEVNFYFSAESNGWERVERSIEASGFNHNVFGEFLSLRAGLISFGKGEVTYDNFVYRKLD